MKKLNRSEFGLVDLQFSHGNNDDIYVKELAFMSGISIAPNYCLFKPPFDKRELTRKGVRKNLYCQKYVNGLAWMDGDIDYCNVGKILAPLNSYKYIFVIGRAKKQFLSQYVDTTIFNLEPQTSLKRLQNYITACPIHNDLRYKCAINNIFKIFIFIEKNYLEIENIVFDDDIFV